MILSYDIPKNKIVEVFDCIPSTWNKLDGTLEIQDKLQKEDDVTKAELVISNGRKSLLGGGANDVILGMKLPHKVYLSKHMKDEFALPIDDFQKLIKGFVQKDYMGWIWIGFMPSYDAIESRESIRIDINKKRIDLEWNEREGGKKENLTSVIEKIESIGLKNSRVSAYSKS